MIRIVFAVAAVALCSTSAFAAKPCDELKSEIATKMDAMGVKDYSLEVIANEQATDKKIVGSCDGGTKKIAYAKAQPSEQPVADRGK